MKTVLQIRAGGKMLGAERVVLDIATHSEHFGYRSIVAMPWGRGEPEPELLRLCREAGVETVPLRGSSQFSVRPVWILYRALQREGVNVIHSHGYREDLYAVAAARGQAMVATNHLWKRTTLRLRLYAAVDQRLLHRFDHVVAVSRPIADEMERAGIAPVSTVFNGVSTDRFVERPRGDAARRSREALGLPVQKLVVTMVSSLTPEKGHALALEAVQRLWEHDFVLAIVGEGRLEDTLQETVRAKGLDDRVRFLGRRSDVPEILAVTDVYLMTSHAEGLPIALLEAMAAGCAVVSTSVGEIASVIEPEISGLLVATEPAPIARALDRVLSDHGFRGRLANGARTRVLEHFSADEMTRHYCAIYDEALAARASA